MNVLHYSFSLSACPKCHLLICKHTSLANLNFNSNEKEKQENFSEEYLTNGKNIYLFPSTILNHRYSWTTNQSLNTIKNFLSNNEILCENIPFSNENIVNSTLILTSKQNSIIQTDYHLKNLEYIQSSYSLIRILWIVFLILSFLITNTIDIVLIYIYYHTNAIYLISFLLTIFLCDIILWIIQLNYRSFYFLFIPFNIRFYFLYQLLEFLIILFNQNFDQQLFRKKKDQLYQNLTLFYLIHTEFLTFINLYICINHLTKNFFNFQSILIYLENIFSNTSQISSLIPYSSLFILISILYYLIINYSLLSTLLNFKKYLFLIILTRLCLLIPRIYTLIFVFYLNISWLIICLFILHFISIILLLLFNQLKFKSKQKKIFLQLIFSLITHQSINQISINILIFFENISIYFYQFYSNQLTLYISILIILEIFGFIFHILFKYIQYQKKSIRKNSII